MSQDNWTSNSSGSWNDNADWSEGAPPADTDNVVIGVAGVTVSVGTDVTNAVALTLTTYNSILDIDGGDLFTLQSAAYNGAFYESAGTYTMSGSGASFYNTMDLTGGTMDALSAPLRCTTAVRWAARSPAPGRWMLFPAPPTCNRASVPASTASRSARTAVRSDSTRTSPMAAVSRCCRAA